MTETQKQKIEENIWKLLKGYEQVYKTVQPTFTYSIENDDFCMKRELLDKLPSNVRIELLKLLRICNS